MLDGLKAGSLVAILLVGFALTVWKIRDVSRMQPLRAAAQVAVPENALKK